MCDDANQNHKSDSENFKSDDSVPTKKFTIIYLYFV